MWEETLVFTVHMPEIALVRFLVWDHDPIGRDFIGQRTLAFSSMMPGRRGLAGWGGAASPMIETYVPCSGRRLPQRPAHPTESSPSPTPSVSPTPQAVPPVGRWRAPGLSSHLWVCLHHGWV